MSQYRFTFARGLMAEIVDMTSILPVELAPQAGTRLWLPDRVLFTPAALVEPWGQQILARVESLNLPIEHLPHNRITGLRGETDRQTIEKSTLQAGGILLAS
jgi:spore photoproduct lyase